MINWKLRFKNKASLLAILAAIVAFVYQMLGLFGVTAPVAEDTVKQAIAIAINILVGIGVVIDPTTSGIKDSANAMDYEELGGEDQEMFMRNKDSEEAEG